jgi:tetratricopeptide (TPR) repeat protein
MQINSFILIAASLSHIICLDSGNLNSRERVAPEDSMQTGKYAEAEHDYTSLLKTQKSGEIYAGLAESLLMQNKVQEAQLVLKEARERNFSNDANVLAVSGHAFYMRAKTVSVTSYSLFLEAAVVKCKRALAIDPTNQIASRTLVLAEERSKKLEKAFAFEKADKFDSAVAEYESILKERSDDVEAIMGIRRILSREDIKKDFVTPGFDRYWLEN